MGWQSRATGLALKRSALTRKAGLRRTKRLRPVSRKSWKKELDALCRQVVFARDGRKCLKCGKTSPIQWAHVESRRYQATRWDTRFSMTLCAGDHLWWHHRPVEASDWWTATFPERATALRMIRSQKQKVDPELVRLRLQLEARQLGLAAGGSDRMDDIGREVQGSAMTADGRGLSKGSAR